MVSIEEFSELLRVLYATSLNCAQWQRFLDLLTKATGFKTGVFLSADANRGLAVLAHGGPHPSDELAKEYNQEFFAHDPFRGPMIHRARARDPIGVYSESEIIPESEFLEGPLYQGLLAPQKMRHGAIIMLSLSVRRLDAVSLWRSAEDGPLDGETRKLLELLIPHIQTALEIRRALGLSEQKLASAEAVANASPTAGFLVTRTGDVRYANAAAELLLNSGEALLRVEGRLHTREPKLNAKLADLLQRAAQADFGGEQGGKGAVLQLPRAGRRKPLQLIATPLPKAERARSHADVLLLATDPERPLRFPDDLLTNLFRFTPSEVEIANALLMGYSLEEAADLRRVTVGTVRQQVKNMLAKTGTSRQSEMVRLFMTLPQLPAQRD